jgi:hypothetical protein
MRCKSLQLITQGNDARAKYAKSRNGRLGKDPFFIKKNISEENKIQLIFFCIQDIISGKKDSYE